MHLLLELMYLLFILYFTCLYPEVSTRGKEWQKAEKKPNLNS